MTSELNPTEPLISEPHESTPEAAPTTPPHWLHLGIGMVAVSTAASLLTTLLCESGTFLLEPEKLWMVTMGNRHLATTAQTVEAAGVANVARIQALLGLSLGLAIGISVALAFHNYQKLIRAGIVGLLGGSIVGFSVAKVAVPLFYNHRSAFDLDLISSILLNGGLAASIGLTTGLAAVIGASVRGRRLVESLFLVSVAAFLGGTVFVIVGAAFFANDDTGEPLSLTFVTRLLSHLLVSLFIALGTMLALNQMPGTPSRTRGNGG